MPQVITNTMNKQKEIRLFATECEYAKKKVLNAAETTWDN